MHGSSSVRMRYLCLSSNDLTGTGFVKTADVNMGDLLTVIRADQTAREVATRY